MGLQNKMPGRMRAFLDGAARARWVRWVRSIQWARALQVAHLSLWTLWASQSFATPISGRMPPPQKITNFAIDRTEVTIGEVAAYAQATGFVSQAEREGGGFEFDGGWTRRSNWTWRTPFGILASPDEPAVHLSFAEAQAVCQWRGMRLPTDAQWIEAGHTERRPVPTPPFERGRSYPYPTGDQPTGAHCLADGSHRAMTPAPTLTRLGGGGHVRTGQTQAGVNGLFDMGGNVWEWVDETVGSERRTRGGSWWYGSAPMHVNHQASKPPQFFAVYVGFRCVAD